MSRHHLGEQVPEPRRLGLAADELGKVEVFHDYPKEVSWLRSSVSAPSKPVSGS
jgi:hypothetical protein